MKNDPSIIIMVGREIAGYYTSLHKGFDHLGIDNHFFFFERSHKFYPFAQKRNVIEKTITVINDVIFNDRPFWQKGSLFCLLYPIVFIVKALYFPYLICRYDVFIFGANYSYLGFYLDRIFLRVFNKTIIDPALGSDVRPPFLSGLFTNKRPWILYFATIFKYYRVRAKLLFSTYVIDHPTTSQFNMRPYIPHQYVGFPFELNTSLATQKTDKKIILHAPSNPKVKGSVIVREAIDELKDTYDFEYRELVGVHHLEVMNELSQCAFVINELYSDVLMSGLDTEAAWFAKPSIIAGYNLDMVTASIEGYEVPPTYRIYPSKEALKEAIIHLLTDDKYRVSLGNRAQEFVRKNWNAQAVAQKYLEIIRGEVPSNVMKTPFQDEDIYGCGINTEDRRKLIRDLVGAYGEKALFLDAKPELKKKLLEDCGIA